MIRIFQQYVSLRSAVLCVVESIFIAFGLLLGTRVWFWNDDVRFQAYVSAPFFLLQIMLVAAVVQTCFFVYDLYNLKAASRRAEQSLRVTNAIGVSYVVLGLTCMIFPGLLVARVSLPAGLAAVIIIVVLLRVGLSAAWRALPLGEIAILGTGELALRMAEAINKRPDLGFRTLGFIRDHHRHDHVLNSGGPILGDADELEEVVARYQIKRLVIAVENQRGALPIRSLVTLRVSGVTIDDAQTMFARLTGRVWLETARPSWFVFSEGFRRSRTTAALKRAGDIVFSLAGLILSLPIMVLVAAAIRLDSAGPIFYRQTRVGYRGRRFELLKFRSMRTDAEAHSGAQWSVIDDPRVTRVGGLIRSLRLDELPQFINVLRGEMSLVGPRPERPFFTEQLREQIAYYDERHSVRPGITGWAQVRYRYGASVEDAVRKLEYDLFYLQNMSFLFDLVIMLQTVRTVLSGGQWVESGERVDNPSSAVAAVTPLKASVAAAGHGRNAHNTVTTERPLVS
jgi:sugar transferase (PEP-CTERM system associated)